MYICNSKLFVMTLLTIKIDERTKEGKAFMAFAKAFFKEGSGVEIISIEKKATSLNNKISVD